MDKKPILIIEKDQILREIYKEILELYNYEVDSTESGLEGIEKFKKIKPSLVIMGEMLDTDEYSTYKQMREHDENFNIIIVSGDLEFESKNQELIEQGVKVILKPILVTELLYLARKYSRIKPEIRVEDFEQRMVDITLKTNKFIKKLNQKLAS